jgi:seryl-tRNA synthetase
MLDAKFVRENIGIIQESLRKRNYEISLDEFLKYEEQRRSLLKEAEELRNRRNVVSEEIGRLRTQKQDASQLIDEMKLVSDKIKAFDEQLKILEEHTNDFLLNVPNLPHDSVPAGKDETENVEVRKWGEPGQFDYEPLNHWDIGAILDILDFDRASKIAGARFCLTKGAGARLERALMNFMLDLKDTKRSSLRSL